MQSHLSVVELRADDANAVEFGLRCDDVNNATLPFSRAHADVVEDAAGGIGCHYPWI